MNTKKLFSDAIMDLDKGMPKGMSECDKFGMTWGCREDCPVFERGECEIQEENEKEFNKTQPP